MLENESQVMKRIYGVNILEEDNRNFTKKQNKPKKLIDNIYIKDYISAKTKKRILIGFQLVIIAAHIAFFILRMFHI
ncbi:MAG: hypothetical protein ACFE8E_01235 [Candidatus Hodarchaeota archaeon]